MVKHSIPGPPTHHRSRRRRLLSCKNLPKLIPPNKNFYSQKIFSKNRNFTNFFVTYDLLSMRRLGVRLFLQQIGGGVTVATADPVFMAAGFRIGEFSKVADL